jgi:precorrin-3B synthase
MPTGDGLLVRVHPPLGILTRVQARAVADGARRFGNGHLDITARANLQIRGVTAASRAPLARLLEDVGLGDVRADGGPQRLTLTSPLAGRDPAETINVPALAHAVESAGLGIPGLPAKTLVVIEGRRDVAMPEADCALVARGSGVVIAIRSGQGQRELLTCGESEAAAAVAALLAAFARTGQRRIRDVPEDELTALTEALRSKGGTHVPTPAREAGPCSASPSLMSFAPSAGLRTQAGLQILAIDAPFGRCAADALDRITAAAETIGADEIRLSPTRGFVLLATAGALAATVLADLAADFIVASDDPRRRIDACTGAPGCASGSTPTLADAARLAEVFRPLAMAGSSAHVSGCAKGCARPGPADVTLVGREGVYGAVIGGAPSDEPTINLPIEAVLERLGRAESVGLAAAFAPETARSECGGTRRPA